MELLNHVYSGSLNTINFSKVKIINTINSHSYCILKKDRSFEKALIESDVLLPDGVGIVYAFKFLKRRFVKKIAGYDLFLHMVNKINTENGSVFFLGSSKNTLEKIESKLNIEYPNIKLSYYSPPFKSEFSEIDSKKMFQKINSFNPDVLFVGMTAPKQEIWVNKHKGNLNAKNICCVGAVFDFYAGNVKRSSSFWINLGLEWLPRLLKEPRRLFTRNFISTPKFILEILSYKFFGRGIL
tara:strand:- start:1402 stop:2121 length:720 start_codon:yes stop_codon:yes gene_type:complete